MKIQITLLLLALRAQNALEAKNRQYPNEGPRADEKDPPAGVQTKLLFHFYLRKIIGR